MKFNFPKSNGTLPTDQHRAMKNYRLMQWAKIATFGLYMVAVFMLYVSDVWGVASFVTQNSNEYIALSVFSIISFVLAYFLASSKEAVYEDIALHRSEGWKLKPTQYAAMGLFLSSGILFEMFSTTNNQQHIANTAAEQSTMMKSIQGTDVSLLGSSGLTDSFASAQMKLAQCEQRLAQGKEKHCAGAKARVDAVRESMAMSNQLATTAAQQSVDNKVDGMLKIREHFDKPMFQAIGKATGTDNNSGMLMVIGVLIFIFECQHIMALFAYANSLARIKRNGGNTGTSGNTDSSPAPLGESAPVSAFAPLADSAKQTVSEFAQKVEQGLKASPEIIAREYARADYANKQVLADAGALAGKIGNKLDAALYPPAPLTETDSFKQSPEQLAFVQREHQKQVDEYERAKQSALSGENTVKYLTPRLSVEETVKAIQSNVKASGATSPDAIQAAVFDTFAAMPNPAPLSDAILERIAGKIIPTNERAHSSNEQIIGERNERTASDDTLIPINERAHSFDAEKELLEAMKDAQGKIEADILKEGYGLYEQWKAAILSGDTKLTTREGRSFVNAHLCQGKKRTITPEGMNALIVIWQARAAKEGVLTLNPKYTGKPPFTKYLLAA